MYTPELAAMLIFLNRTGFNGLFRLNRRGGFNVPVGRYTNPTICDEAHLRAVASALASPSDHARVAVVRLAHWPRRAPAISSTAIRHTRH